MPNIKYLFALALLLITSCTKKELETPTKFVHDITFNDELHHSDPTINLKIFGANTKMVLDTGSSQIFLMNKFVNALPQFTSTSKSAIPTSFENLEIHIGASTFQSKENMVIPDINGFSESGLAGIISPQSLTLRGGLVIDFPNKKFIDLPTNTTGLNKQLIDLYPNIKFQKIEWIGQEEGMMLIKTSLNNKAPVLTDIDTGSPYTSYCAAYAGQIETELGISSYGADNKKMDTKRTKKSQMIKFLGSNSIQQKIVVLPLEEDEATNRWCGSFGMDILKDYIIVISPSINGYILLGTSESQ